MALFFGWLVARRQVSESAARSCRILALAKAPGPWRDELRNDRPRLIPFPAVFGWGSISEAPPAGARRRNHEIQAPPLDRRPLPRLAAFFALSRQVIAAILGAQRRPCRAMLRP